MSTRLWGHQPPDHHQVGRVGAGLGGGHLGQVDAVRCDRDRHLAAQDGGQPVRGLGRGRDDVVGQPHGQPLDQPSPAQQAAPVRQAPHLVPGHHQPLALERGDQAQRQDLQERDVVGLEHVEVAAQQPQAADREPDRLAQRAPVPT
jgi:hypothetical protein